ncbi:MAG: PDZ domain-containing protein [Nitrospiraceae bacterium]|nr:PDZ domain-containing protein [Nitrospiraceae bacterium]
MAFSAAWCETAPDTLQARVVSAVEAVKPALVRIRVVETNYSDGRELKYEASGSGVIISEEGYVVTNHHVAGHAVRLSCTLADKEEVDAELVAGDPLSDIAVIKLSNEGGRKFPTASFGDSSQVAVGDHVLAMGSPMALSQSVTQGIISNIEMIMPRWIRRYGGIEQDGEDVGSLVKWIGHDAQIYGGNSGGPLVNLDGQVIGINEISMALGGAIPGNLAREVAEALIAEGKVKRAWFGLSAQPTLRHSGDRRGVLLSGTVKGSPAESAGLQGGDILLRVNGAPVAVRFDEQLPDFNRILSGLTIGEPASFAIVRDGSESTVSVTPVERERVRPQEHELKPWGITASNISFIRAKEMKRKDRDGVLVTSVRRGGPAGDAKPSIVPGAVIVEVDGKPVKCWSDLVGITKTLTEGQDEPVPVLTTFERKAKRHVTVVKVGLDELDDPGLEVKKAWLPVATQVLTRDIAQLLGDPALRGFLITQVYPESTAEAAGLQTGDFILAVDGEKLTASAPEHYEELSAIIRQYKVGMEVVLDVLRGTERLKAPVELVRAPELDREMKEYRDENFELTVREISFFDKAREQLAGTQQGVLVSDVKPGGWAALGEIRVGDILLEVDEQEVAGVAAFGEMMKSIAKTEPDEVVLKVLRGIYTFYVELEPKWNMNR